MPDAYMSVVEALRHAGFHHGAKVELDWIDAELVPGLLGTDRLRGLDGIVIPGGFGERGIEGMVAAAGYARDHGIPCLGLCLGLQVMVIAVARDLAGLERANSREFDSLSPHTVIDLMPDQAEVTDKGGTMRLGSYQAVLLPGSKVAEAYGTLGVTERHRHRYEFNNRTRASSRTSAWSARAARPTGAWSSSSSWRTTPSGWRPRPTPSSRAGPTGPTRCSASWWRRRWSGPTGASPTCSTSTPSPSGATCAGFPPCLGGGAPPGLAVPGRPLSTCVDPDDEPFDRVVVRHPGAVTVVPVHDDGTVTLVRQYRAAVDRWCSRSLPGRATRTAKPPRHTARRELIEEAGLEADRWELLIGTWNTPGVSDQHTLIYLATGSAARSPAGPTASRRAT